MDKLIYNKIVEVLYQFMDLEVSNNLFWNGAEEYSRILFKECGYEVTDWSWYDGHIVNLKSTEYPEVRIGYAACAHSYCIYGYPDDKSVNVTIEEISKLKPLKKRTPSDYDEIKLIQINGNKETKIDVSLSQLSSEFNHMIKKLMEWQLSFDKSEDFDYNITIHIGNEVIIDEL